MAAIASSIPVSGQQPADPMRSAAKAQPASTDNPVELRYKLHYLGGALFFDERKARRRQNTQNTAPTTNAKNGAGLSWRVHLLPFVGEQDLYEQFHFDEPWDSPHNRQLLKLMPSIYQLGPKSDGTTRYRMFTGPKQLFAPDLSMNQIEDGPDNTITVVVVGPDAATPWTKADDLPVTEDPWQHVGRLPDNKLESVLANGKILTIPRDVPPEALAALITPQGGEVVDAEAIRRRTAPTTNDSLAPAKEQALSDFEYIRRVEEQMKRIVLAMHNYHDHYKCFPVAKNDAHFDERGKSKLSWRVHILQFLGQEPLFKKFKLDEPWDSPNNIALIPLMPDAFRDPKDETDKGMTRYVTLVGKFGYFADDKPGPRIREATDHTSNTLIFVQAGTDRAIPWTKPADPYFDPTQPLECLGDYKALGFGAARIDGAIMFLRPTISAELFRALVTPTGKEFISDPDLRQVIVR